MDQRIEIGLNNIFKRKSQTSDYYLILKVFFVSFLLAIINPSLWVVITLLILYIFYIYICYFNLFILINF